MRPMPEQPSIEQLAAFVRYAQDECDRIDGLSPTQERDRALEALTERLGVFEESVPTHVKQQAIKEAGIWQE
jgi:hypothetical protein